MSFKGKIELAEILADKIIPFDKKRIDSAKYELSLGKNYYTTGGESFKVQEAIDNQIVINPGQFCFLETEEKIEIPKEYIGFISIKAGIKFRGLINISGFHVDPGFKGKLIYSVYNAGSNHINLKVGEALFQLWLADISSSTTYKGEHQGQSGITSDLINKYFTGGKVASPSELRKEIEELKAQKTRNEWLLKMLIGITLSLLISFLISVFTSFTSSLFSPDKESIKSEVINELKKEELKSNEFKQELDNLISIKFDSIRNKQQLDLIEELKKENTRYRNYINTIDSIGSNQ